MFKQLEKISLILNAIFCEVIIKRKKIFDFVFYRLDCVFEGRPRLETTQEVEMADDATSISEVMEVKEPKNCCRKESRGAIQTIQERPASLDLLPHVRINISPETPVSTLKYMVASSKARLSYNKKELRNSEELMTRALIQFYQKLQVLKGYR